MNIQGLSDDTLKSLHKLIQKAVGEDDAAPAGAKPYGVREYHDWKIQADDYEAELDRRSLSYQKIDWTKK